MYSFVPEIGMAGGQSGSSNRWAAQRSAADAGFTGQKGTDGADGGGDSGGAVGDSFSANRTPPGKAGGRGGTASHPDCYAGVGSISGNDYESGGAGVGPGGTQSETIVSTNGALAYTAQADSAGTGTLIRALRDGAEVDVAVEAFAVGEPRVIAMDDPRLCVGIQEVEHLEVERLEAEGAPGAWALWTAGRSRLPCALWAGLEGAAVLRFDLAGEPLLPGWAEPAQVTHPAQALGA